MDTQLLVIGDSHATFWNGTGDSLATPVIPGIRSVTIPGALAWDLLDETSSSNARRFALGAVATAMREGFDGHIMLSFGSGDCDTSIWREVHQFGLQEAVKRCVDRYVAFILTVRSLHNKVAIWGPIAAVKADVDDGVVGSEAERNLAILVFTAMLEERLTEHEVPVVSMAEKLLDAPMSPQKMMSYALRVVNTALRLQLGERTGSPLKLDEHLVREFADARYIELFDKTWLQLVVPEGAQFFTDLSISREVFSAVGNVGVATTWDGKNFEYEEITQQNSVPGADGRHIVHIQRHARKLFIYGQMRTLAASEINLYIRGTQLQQSESFDRATLLALRDRIVTDAAGSSEVSNHIEASPSGAALAAPPKMVVKDLVLSSAPPSTRNEVIFSEPPSMRAGGEVIFSAPPSKTMPDDSVRRDSSHIPTVSEIVKAKATATTSNGYDVTFSAPPNRSYQMSVH